MMMNLELAARYHMLPPGSRVLCAVSGGADSMCLLHLLWSGRGGLGIEVAAAHYEHGLRGEESQRDAEFVERFCREREIACLVEHGDAAAYGRKKHLGIEEAARELRYDFLRRAAAELNCDKIATAHNADDNAETIIFNLCRGGGLGLGGIPPVRGNIIRPLLGCTRAEIEEYLRDNSIPHVEDSSNESDAYSRNLIRHHVMPVLRSINPGAVLAAGRAARLLREDEECLEAQAAEFTGRFFDGASLPQRELAALPRAIAARAVRRLCPKTLSLAHVDAALGLCGGSGLAFADLPGIRLRREQGRIYFTPMECLELPDKSLVPGQTLEIPEAGLRLRSEIAEHGGEINDLFKTYCFKYESICGNISCTGRRPGDRLRPIGRGCTKSLKSLFLEAGMTQDQRRLTPVFRDEKGILAVYGLAADERTQARRGEKILRIDIERLQTGR